MTKTQLKKQLKSLSHDDLVLLLLELYDVKKEAKDFLNYHFKPNEKEKFEEYRAIIEDEFTPHGRKVEQLRFSVCKKAISNFAALKPSPVLQADLMLFLAEQAAWFTAEFGDMWEQYYISAVNNFKRALVFIEKYNLKNSFMPRIIQCLRWSDECGWGFPDDMYQAYYDVFNEEPPV